MPEPPSVTRTKLRRDTNLPDFNQHPYSQHTDPSGVEKIVWSPAQATSGGYDQHSDYERSDGGDQNAPSSGEEVDDAEQQAEESEDELQQSVGVELNQRLMAATEARNRGEEAVLDADWEQWLKEAAERGATPDVAIASAGHGYARPGSIWPPHLPGVFDAGSASIPLTSSFPLSAAATSTLGGPSAPPAGTAM
ncbi:MAG: hypothetical protein Q9219_007445 [cf. Caloplaca sp. 3 TL-2023]